MLRAAADMTPLAAALGYRPALAVSNSEELVHRTVRTDRDRDRKIKRRSTLGAKRP